MRPQLITLAVLLLFTGCSLRPRAHRDPVSAIPAIGHAHENGRGIEYVDFVPTPEEIKANLESDGWTDVAVIQTIPDYLQGPIRAISLFDLQSRILPSRSPQEYGRVSADRIHYLNLEFGAGGIVTAPLTLPDGARAITFHVAVKQHYVMIIWNPAERAGYVWRSFIYGADGTPMEMRFLMQRQDLERI